MKGDEINHPFGAKVDYFIPGGGGSAGSGIVVGQLAEYPSVVVVASGNTTGMSINAAHCTVRGWDIPTGARWRKRYLKACPDANLLQIP